MFSNKELFLTSDKDWREVLTLLPAVIWTENDSIIKHPVLVYHDEPAQDTLLINEDTYETYAHYNGEIDTVTVDIEDKELHEGETKEFEVQ